MSDREREAVRFAGAFLAMPEEAQEAIRAVCVMLPCIEVCRECRLPAPAFEVNICVQGTEGRDEVRLALLHPACAQRERDREGWREREELPVQ